MSIHYPIEKDTYHYSSKLYNDCDLPPRHHHNIQIIYVLHGNLTMEVNKHQERMTHGDFALIFPYQVFSVNVLDTCHYWVGSFSGNIVPEFDLYYKDKIFNTQVFHCRHMLEIFLKNCLISTLPSDPFLLKGLLYSTYSEFISTAKYRYKPANNDNLQVPDLIKEYISAHHSENISLKDIAKMIGYEYYYLSRNFKKITGTNFRDLLNQYRIESAKSMLLDNHVKALNITDIAHKCGFQCLRTFNRVFKIYTGIEPRQFQNQVKDSAT